MPLKENLEEFVNGLKDSLSNIKELGLGFKESTGKIINKASHPAAVGALTSLYSIYGYATEKYVSATAALATTLYGIFAYALGKWPFTEIAENEYQPLQWFTGHKGRILKGPGTTWFLSPLERKIIRNKELQRISAETLQNDFGGFDFRTADGLSGTLNVQYLYQVTDKKGAAKFFWDYGKDPTRLNEPIRGTLVRTISKSTGQEFLRERSYLGEAENEANKTINGDEGAGIKVTNFAITNPIFDPPSDTILKTEAAAKANAVAIVIQAQAEATEAYLQQEATRRNIDGYIEVGKKLYTNPEDASRAAERMHFIDNVQQIFSSIRSFFTRSK